MATFEDPIQEEELELEEEVVEEQQEPEVEEATPEPEIPEKYRGKSLADIVKMHQESEKLIGRQAQEVGEVRKLADELLKRELSQKKSIEPQEEETDDSLNYFEDPAGAVNKAVENHPAIQQAKQQAFEYKQQQVSQKLRSEFPNFDEVIQDQRFFNWINASPVRTRLFTEAHSQYDYESAAELLSTWNAMNPVKESAQDDQIVTESRKETTKNLKTAAVDTGSPAPSSRKIYRRSDLINLRLRDPARYEAMQDEIMAAYAEGRVK